jgi:hypothetical protein
MKTKKNYRSYFGRRSGIASVIRAMLGSTVGMAQTITAPDLIETVTITSTGKGES